MNKLRAEFNALYKDAHKKGSNWNIAYSLIKGMLNSDSFTFVQEVVVSKLIKMLGKQKDLSNENMKEFVQILDVAGLNLFRGLEQELK